jgi:hypothetical protein
VNLRVNLFERDDLSFPCRFSLPMDPSIDPDLFGFVVQVEEIELAVVESSSSLLLLSSLLLGEGDLETDGEFHRRQDRLL